MILCCGEALIDMVPEGDLFRPLPGGSVYNTAVALGRLGARTGFLWPMSRDPFATLLLAGLTAAGVDTRLCPRVDRPTTLAFVTLSQGEARYSFYDEGSAGRLFTRSELPQLPKAVEAVLIGGISLVSDPAACAIEALAEREGNRVPLFLDPNIRPAFIGEETAYRERLQRLMRRAAIVKISMDDLAWLWPGRTVEDCATAVLALGPRVVLTTAGAGTAQAFHADGALSVPAPRVAVVDTIGAGDTYNAGVLAALARAGVLDHDGLARIDPKILHAAVTQGVAAAALSVSRAGADPPWEHEL